MGLSENMGKITYVNFKDGQLATKEANGEIKFFKSLTGILTNIDFKDDEYKGKKFEKMNLTFVDGAERFLLQFRFDSGYARGFWQTIESVDLSKPFTITANKNVKNGKEEYTTFVSQGDKAFKWNHTKDNPGKMPQLVITEYKGEKLYDNTAQLAWVKDMLLNKIKPSLSSHFIAEATTTPVAVGVKDDVADDLPF